MKAVIVVRAIREFTCEVEGETFDEIREKSKKLKPLDFGEDDEYQSSYVYDKDTQKEITGLVQAYTPNLTGA